MKKRIKGLGIAAALMLALAAVFFHFNPLHAEDVYEGADKSFLTQLNQLRVQKGLPEFKTDADLTALARLRAEEALVLCSHTRPDGSRGCDLVLAENPDAKCSGENLVSGKKLTDTYAAKAFQKLCDSPTHFANMVNPDFTTVGIVTLTADDGHVVTVFLFEG